MTLKKKTLILKAMANAKRLEILRLLKNNEENVGNLEKKLDLSQSALSQHLALLRKANILKTRRQAQNVFYQLKNECVIKLLNILEEE
ncbi:MAG: winged helix-turn-helix transcriptional regulator [Alphaproteobacteria bacterium]|nr:winged helix-turn-helix transcriptional regulator [Alphaproteobacteria bacterium]